MVGAVVPSVMLPLAVVTIAVIATSALFWMLRSWFLPPWTTPLSTRFWVRMCHGAPVITPEPFAAPPADLFQKSDWARWPPQSIKTAPLVSTGPGTDPLATMKWTTMSALLLPVNGPEYVVASMAVIVAP